MVSNFSQILGDYKLAFGKATKSAGSTNGMGREVGHNVGTGETRSALRRKKNRRLIIHMTETN